MPTRPDLPKGYLGPQPKFSELGLSMFSHVEPDFSIDKNSLEIKIKFTDKVKVTHQLIRCSDEKDLSEFVFTQTLNNLITFIISLPCSDYYKFQIFALPADDDSKSLPNVLNYLINCEKALHPCFPYPKQYAQWKDGCYLKSPICLHEDMELVDVPFDVTIPGANGVAVVADGEWFHCNKKGNHWEGNFNLNKFKGKKITLNANLVPSDDTKYSTMLEYKV